MTNFSFYSAMPVDRLGGYSPSVVVHQSLNYTNRSWLPILREHAGHIVFMGTENEYTRFRKIYGSIPFVAHSEERLRAASLVITNDAEFKRRAVELGCARVDRL